MMTREETETRTDLLESLRMVKGFDSATMGQYVRDEAVTNVLMRLPIDALNVLSLDQPRFYAPDIRTWGQADFKVEDEVIYLSPVLELGSIESAMAVVAHELAHLVLGHVFERAGSSDELDKAEKQTWNLVEEWGFKEEVAIYQKVHENLLKFVSDESGVTTDLGAWTKSL